MSQASRFIGRFRNNDGRTAGRVGDTAEKMELARFPGHQVIAEREGDDLVIYQIGDGDGLGVIVNGNTADRAPKTIADLQKVYDAAYATRETPRQRMDRQSSVEAVADLARSPVR
jgi:hypothetical protein